MSAPSLSNVFSDVYITGNCTVKGTISSLAGSITSQWTTSGTLIYYTTGNVGIGTNNPSGSGSAGTVLHVADSTSSNPTVHVDASIGTGQARLHLRSGTGSTNRASRIDFFNNVLSSTAPQWTIISGYDQNGTNDMRYVNYAGAITMAWAQNGNIGIGTTNPGSLLTVSGGVGIGSGYQAFTAPTGGLIVQGNVGIGTSNPGLNALQVSGNVVTSGFTSNATNTVFNFDTLTVPFVVATQVSSSSSNPLQITSNTIVSGNIYATDTISSANPMMFRNRLINGDMRINQRGATSVAVPSTTSQYLLDRWSTTTSATSGYFTSSVQTLTTSDAPYQYGLRSSMRCTATTGNSPTYIYPFYQSIEANNLTDLNWGSAYGASATVSFWFRSNMTAGSTGSFSIRNANAGGAWSLYNNTFTVTGGGTWQYVVVTIPAPPSGTTWNTGTSAGIEFLALGYFSPVSGTIGWSTSGQTGATQTAWFATTGNYIEITGVQFEKGLTASPFEFRSYGAELALCQRYFQIINCTGGQNYYAGLCGGVNGYTCSIVTFKFSTAMRVTPTQYWYTDQSPQLMTVAGGTSAVNYAGYAGGTGISIPGLSPAAAAYGVDSSTNTTMITLLPCATGLASPGSNVPLFIRNVHIDFSAEY